MQQTQLLEAIRKKLIAEYVANTTTWKCFIGYTPDDQDQVISLTLSGGFPFSTLNMESTHPTFQLTVRAGYLDRAACEAKWWAAFNALHEDPPPYRIPLPDDPPPDWRTLAASGIVLIDPMATGPLEWYDMKNRINMSINYRVTMTNV